MPSKCSVTGCERYSEGLSGLCPPHKLAAADPAQSAPSAELLPTFNAWVLRKESDNIAEGESIFDAYGKFCAALRTAQLECERDVNKEAAIAYCFDAGRATRATIDAIKRAEAAQL